MATTARLPGIYFESVTLAPAPVLPRMDIAAFAGFLPSGPVGVPVAVEDPDRFTEIFGTDLQLAWDATLREMRLAQTAPAVRAFFRNGGTRCWVLRLAKNALANAWTVPGLLQVDANGVFHSGWVSARSEGSWSDELTVNATLLESPLPEQPAGWPGQGSEPQAPQGLNPGDVAQLYYPLSGAVAYYEAEESGGRWFWFQPALTIAAPAGNPDSVEFLGAGSDTPVAFTSFSLTNGLALGVTRDVAMTIAPGQWLRLAFGAKMLLAQVENIDAGATGSPAGETATITSTLLWWAADAATTWAANRAETPQSSIVTFELWAWPQGEPAMQISSLGFSPFNPQYWGLLPTDAALYAPVTGSSAIPYAALSSAIDNPRFPLAGPMANGGGAAGLGIPLGMTALVNAGFTQGATQPGATALDRDGLTVFNQELFLDPLLEGLSSAALPAQAFFVQYQMPDARPLEGVHALMGTDEISMIAAPDAVHSGWTPAPATPPALMAPDPVDATIPNEEGIYLISWNPVAGAAGYLVAQSGDPLFASGATSTDVGPANSTAYSSTAQCPEVLYYRVSAYGANGASPWSKTVQVSLGNGDFAPCNSKSPSAPQLEIVPDRNRVVLSWSPAALPGDAFTLATSSDPLFASDPGHALYQGSASGFDYWATPGPPSYFRVSLTRNGVFSPWSNTVSTSPAPAAPWVVQPFPPYDPSSAFTAPPVLLAVHAGLVTMAGARGDLVAVLSLPYSFKRAEALAYRSKLGAALAGDPLPTLPSFGALYHPWVVTVDNTNAPPQSLRSLVPDGAACGAIASTTLASGAWIAAANVALANAVALAPVLDSASPLAFAAGQINLIAQQPAGFLITSQDTLMPDGDALEPLNVRRLLILVRRLALREGVRYVFQNNSPSLQRAIGRQFQAWMQQLLLRGAFAGASAQDSYQVIVDSTVNTQAAMDQGQFIVQLLIAPSVPMQFLTVKLVQSGGQLTLVEG